MKKKKVSVVIAAFNEEGNILELTQRIVKSLSDYDFEIIYSLAGTDNTYSILKDYGKANPKVLLKVIHDNEPSGLGNDFKKGFELVDPKSDYILTMDADLNHQPEEAHRLLSALNNNDMVIGSRFVKGGTSQNVPWLKSMASDVGNFVYSIVFNIYVQDKSSGYRAYTKKALKKVLTYESKGFEFLMEIILIANDNRLKIQEVPINFIFRVAGTSKFRFFKTGKAYLRLLIKHIFKW